MVTGTCFRCNAAVEVAEMVGRRDVCCRCGQELRCCRNCRFYDPSRNNQCREPQAERQVDKERANFCEYFSFGPAPSPVERRKATVDARSKLEALFRPKES